MPKKESSKEQSQPRVASMNPDDLVPVGLKNDFWAEITEAEACVFDYKGNASEYGCSPAVRIVTVDDDGEEYEDFLIAGDLRYIVPSEDGVAPAGGLTIEEYASLQGYREQRDGPIIVDQIPTAEELEAMRGPSFLVVKGGGFANNKPWAFFLQSLKSAGYEEKGGDWGEGIPGLVGFYGHWMRHVPDYAKKQGGIVNAEGGERKAPKDVLVLDEVTEKRSGGGASASKKKAASGGSAKKTASKAKAKEADEAESEGESEGGADFDMAITEAILGAIEKAKGEPITKQQAATAAFQAFKDDKASKIAAMKRAGDSAFYEESEVLEFDEEANAVTVA